MEVKKKMEPEYNITPVTPKEIPSRKSKSRTEYLKILTDFFNSNELAISIDASNAEKKLSSIYIGLKKALAKSQFDGKIKIKLNKTTEKIYIQKI